MTRDGERVRVLLTLDRTWWHRAGLGRLTYGGSLRRAGALVRVVDETALRSLAARTEPAPDAGAPAPSHARPPEPQPADIDACRALLRDADGLVLSGGGDLETGHGEREPRAIRRVRPVRDRLERALATVATERGLPVLGLCRGAQLLAVASGGSLRGLEARGTALGRHRRGRAHAVQLDDDSLLAEIYGTTRLDAVLSHHAHAVATVPPPWHVSGVASDGVIEAIEHRDGDRRGWRVGVQWHAELPLRNSRRRALWRAFVREAERIRTVRPADRGEWPGS